MPITPSSPRRPVSTANSTHSAPGRPQTAQPVRTTRTYSAPPARVPAQKPAFRPLPSPQLPAQNAPPRWPLERYMEFYRDQVNTADEQLVEGDVKGARETLQATAARLRQGVNQFRDIEVYQKKIKEWLAETQQRIVNVDAGAGKTAGTAAVPADSPTQQSNAEVEALVKSCIQKDFPKVQWEDVLGIDEAVERVREAVEMPYLFPQLFAEGGLQPWRGILLWGPPGTGKTMLAQAAATSVKAEFYVVSSADINSKWMGQGEKFVKELFRSARQQRSIIFVDEIDAILKARAEGEHEATRRIKTQFLQEMEGFSAQHEVTVIGATNVPWEIDDAALRRLEARVWMALPSADTRWEMLKSKMKPFNHCITDDQFRELAEFTNNYSGNDIRLAIKAAAMETVKAVARARFFAPNAQGMLEPCDANAPGAIPKPSPEECPTLQLQTGITFAQLKLALRNNPPVVDSVRMQKYDAYKKRLENDRS